MGTPPCHYIHILTYPLPLTYRGSVVNLRCEGGVQPWHASCLRDGMLLAVPFTEPLPPFTGYPLARLPTRADDMSRYMRPRQGETEGDDMSAPQGFATRREARDEATSMRTTGWPHARVTDYLETLYDESGPVGERRCWIVTVDGHRVLREDGYVN